MNTFAAHALHALCTIRKALDVTDALAIFAASNGWTLGQTLDFQARYGIGE